MLKLNCTCRKALPHDDVESIAKYIHLTDPYIYPSICTDPTDAAWVDLIRQCMQTKGNIFCIDNLSVIELDQRIVGIACVVPCGQPLQFLEGLQLTDDLLARLHPVVEGYFLPLIKESADYSGHNITNICIDPAHRGNGLGECLMTHCLLQYGNDILHLDVIASNEAAVRLYRRCGFTIANAYSGFSGTDFDLPCYHMLYTPKAAQ